MIVELIDHTSTIADLNDRGDLVGPPGGGQGADQRPADPGGDRRPAQAGQEPAAQLAAQHAGGPRRRRRDHRAGHRRHLRRATVRRGWSSRPARASSRRSSTSRWTTSATICAGRRRPRGREVLRVEVGAPSPLLKGGLAFIDTPGVGGHGQPHLSATLGLLPDADAMLMVSDTSQEFTEPEMRFIRQAARNLPGRRRSSPPRPTCTRTGGRSSTPTPRTCSAPGCDLPMIPASSLLRSHAITLNDKELNEESNFPAIVKFLSEKVLSRENDRVRDQVVCRNPFGCRTSDAGGGFRAVRAQRSRRSPQAHRGPGAAQAGGAGRAAADRAVAAGPQRRHRRSDRRRRPRPAGPVPGHHPAHRAGHRRLRPDPALGRDRRARWRTTSPTPSATTSSGPTSAPRRWPPRWPAPSSRPASTPSRCREVNAREMGAGVGEAEVAGAAWSPSRSARATR